MADKTTSWVLNLVDKITAPMKNMMKSVKSATTSFSKMAETSKKSQEDIRVSIQESKNRITALNGQLKSAEKGLQQLGDILSKTAPGKAQEQLRAEFEEQEKKVNDLKNEIAKATVETEDFQKQLKETSQTGTTSSTELIVKFNQFNQLIRTIADNLKFTADYQDLKGEIQKLTDLTGAGLTDFTKKSREIADVYGQDAMNVAKAVNSMAKQFGGSFALKIAVKLIC